MTWTGEAGGTCIEHYDNDPQYPCNFSVGKSSLYCLTSQCFPITPTGQIKCFDNDGNEIYPCPSKGQDFYGQDAQFIKPRTFTCAGGPCSTIEAVEGEIVIDSLTNMIWQRYLPPTYTGCTGGDPVGSMCMWDEAMNYCKTLNYAGNMDWRLPNPFELASIVDIQNWGPVINTEYFPGTFDYWFWTSSQFVADDTHAWDTFFYSGDVGHDLTKSEYFYVRCLRSGNIIGGNNGRFVEKEPVKDVKVVWDVTTGLMWQYTFEPGQTWQNALSTCSTTSYAGFDDWRLPNRNELLSLVNTSSYAPATDFPNMPVERFWSSCTQPEDTAQAWDVNYNDGYLFYSGKTDLKNVRCVRLGLEPTDGGFPDGGADAGAGCESVIPPIADCQDYGGNLGWMCNVPVGCFMMGCNGAVDLDCLDTYYDEYPYHPVTCTSEYKIDKFEVTVSQYTTCIDNDGGCSTPGQGDPCNWGISGRENHPINCVDWDQAWAYCKWVGKRLPSEAEWEKASRGVDGRKYPWGNTEIDCDHAVQNVTSCGITGTAIVGSKPLGVSPYGAMDMTGNVWEWVEDDWHDDYTGAPTDGSAWICNPTRCSSRVWRGGSWGNEHPDALRSSHRDWGVPTFSDCYNGFRCAQ